MNDEEWKQLNLIKGICSYSQERIWLDETIRSFIIENDRNLFNYNSVVVYQITDGYLFINRFKQALIHVLNKHQIFVTSYEYDSNDYCVKQKINSINAENNFFEISSFDEKDFSKIDQIIFQEQTKKSFDLTQGKIFRCHLLKQNTGDSNRLSKSDYILLIFHHSSIDEYSKYLFFKDLTSAYQNNKNDFDSNQFQLIDYAFYERQFDLNQSQLFWEDYFSDYNFNQKLTLPYDNKTFNSISSGENYLFQIDKSLTRQLFRYKTKTNMNLFRLFLSIFYCYLFKLTQEKDLAITGVTPNRYQKKLNHIIGPLENLVIYRLILDPTKSFSQLNQQVQQLCFNIKENCFYPYQKFIAYARKFSSIQFPFSQISLRVYIDDDQWILDIDNNLILNEINLNDHQLFQRNTKLTPIELTLNVICNLQKQTIQFVFNYSNKLFQEETIQLLAKRFQKLLKHLFDVSSTFDLEDEPIYKLSIILPHEETLLHQIKTPNDEH